VDGLGNPTHVELTEGQVHDIKPVSKILEDCQSTTILADKGYDCDALIERLESQGCAAIIPPKRNRKVKREYDRDRYKSRFLVEQFFQKIKRNRRVATRYEKLAATFLGMVLLACIVLWVF
jgi:transposase